MAQEPDLFEQLLVASWRQIEFPVSRMRASLAHDLAEHRYYGVDGARVETTGLTPARYHFTVPLINGIRPGRNESWGGVDLYPSQLRFLLEAFAKKETGELQHPEFGVVNCKAEHFDIDWSAERRGGTDVELSFVETLTDADQEVAEETPVQKVNVGDLDTEQLKLDLKTLLETHDPPIPLPPYLTAKSLSLTDIANKIKAVTDFPSVLQYRVAGRINEVFYHAKRIQQSADKLRSPATWTIARDVERLKSEGHNAKENLLKSFRSVAFFTVPAATTLAGVARQIPAAKVGDLISLNPKLMARPEIDKGTVVRYYA